MLLTPADIKQFRAMKEAEVFAANRKLTDKDSARFDKQTPGNWFQRQPLIPGEETPKASGYGYVQSPYTSFFTKMWGVNPLVDLPKYRMMYRTVPIIKKAVQKTVATAISKGFEIELVSDVPNRTEILEYLKSWLEQQEDFKVHLQMLASDALIYGNAYAEIVYDETEITEETSDSSEFQRVEIADPSENFKMGTDGIPTLNTITYQGNGRYLNISARGNPVWIKPLDPLWMRVRRDSYGNIFGYLQYLSTPPVAFTNEKIIHIRFNPQSWWTENAYGTSMLLALVRTQEAIWTIENDLILISHACAKPPLIFSCGDKEDEPWSESQLSGFVTATSGRGPGGDIYHRGDVDSKPLPFPASSLAPLLAHLDYHVEQRMISLGVPPDLLGVHASSNRSVATVSFDDWINTIQLLQQQMADAVQEQLFKPIIEKAFGEGTPIPRMVWNQVYEKDDSAEIQKIMTLRVSNIITTNEARAWLSEVGKKFEPVTDGDSLLPPQAFIPTDEEKNEDREKESKSFEREMPTKDSVFDDIASAKAEEYSEIKIKEPFLYTPKKKEVLKADIAESGVPFLTGQPTNQLMYPLLGKPKKKDFMKKVASILKALEEPKDLRNVKIEKLEDKQNTEVWLIDADIAADRYDKKWNSTDGKSWIGGHNFVFQYIPTEQIWISNKLPVEERSKVILHEFTERSLMEKGMAYDLAHIEALKTEGNITEAEIKERAYLPPEEVKNKLNATYSKNDNGTWQMGNHIIKYDEKAGIVYVYDGEKIVEQLLIRDIKDLD